MQITSAWDVPGESGQVGWASPAGFWASRGAEVQAIINVAESAHRGVAAGWKIGPNPSRPCPGLVLEAEQVGQQHGTRGDYRRR